MEKIKNPHIRRMKQIEAKSGFECSDFDIQTSDDYGKKKCGKCGSNAYFKPTVGTFVCYCGSLLRQGEWV